MSDPELTYLYISVAGVLGLIQGLINIALLRRVPVGEPGMYGQKDSYVEM